ncbi:TPA: hypothetical protein N0F65_000065 [Lagenidium giganteum]|uniref:Retroviral polymerase SH3-like domain-containing protein n=1 Tax=Lagenidium giganteum TaxID=4803 RepID=A0AAV2YIX8_9STRA|nr:TPA: hypothetical protein N0F65_000065 [Lagenidium giganteum]
MNTIDKLHGCLTHAFVIDVENIVESKALNHQTPYEARFGTRPSISRLRVWGCVTFWFVVKAQRASKLAPLRRPDGFVGYPTNTTGYRNLDMESGKIVERRNVIFDESHSVDKVYVATLLRRTYEKSTDHLPPHIPYVTIEGFVPVATIMATGHATPPRKRVRIVLPDFDDNHSDGGQCASRW